MALFDENSEARTERPTERHRRQARERGQVAHSVEVLTAARLLAIWIVLAGWLVKFATSASSSLRTTLEHAGSNTLQPSTAFLQLRDLAWLFLTSASWPLVTVAAALLVAHFAQAGWLWRWENVAPQASRLSPIAGLHRLLSLPTIGRVLKLTMKLALVSGAIGFVLSPPPLLTLGSTSSGITDQLSAFGTTAVQLVTRVAVVLLIYAALDYAWQRWHFERSLQMTREEVREELKETDGDPRVKGHRPTQARRPSPPPTPRVSSTSPFA